MNDELVKKLALKIGKLAENAFTDETPATFQSVVDDIEEELREHIAAAEEAAKSDLMECGHPRMFQITLKSQFAAETDKTHVWCSLCHAQEQAVAERTKELQTERDELLVTVKFEQAEALKQEAVLTRVEAELTRLKAQVEAVQGLPPKWRDTNDDAPETQAHAYWDGLQTCANELSVALGELAAKENVK